MAFDEIKDKELASVELGSGLLLSVHSYNGGAPKLQVGPRKITKAGGEPGFRKAGRLDKDEVSDLLVHLEPGGELGKALGM
jgi:hypothetical protein